MQVRRKDRTLSEEESLVILKGCEYGFMATVSEDGSPYVIPLSYVFTDGAIYFHCAINGHKLNNLRHSPKVCFSVAESTMPVYDGGFSTYYRSAVVFGTALKVTDQKERHKALADLCEKYLPDYMNKVEENITKSDKITLVYKITPERISGKSKKRPA